MKDILTIMAEHFILKGICETLDTNYLISKEEIISYYRTLRDSVISKDKLYMQTNKLYTAIILGLIPLMKKYIPVADVISCDEGIAIYYYTGYVDYERDER